MKISASSTLWKLLYGLCCAIIFCITPMVSQAEGLSSGQSVYVPVYSSIYFGERIRSLPLSVTISFRNTDSRHSITLLAADYYDTQGLLLNRYIPASVQIKPMATYNLYIKPSEKGGGAGANFVVRWKSDQPVNTPIVESVMIGSQSGQGISFTSRGQEIQER